MEDLTRMPSPEHVDLLVVGGGQAGLATAHAASRDGLSCVVVERNQRVGDSWRERYDSLRLFTPDRYSNLPGPKLGTSDIRYPSKDDVADYLERYAESLDVRTGTTVTSLTKADSTFVAATTDALFIAPRAVVATGPFQTPRLPEWHSSLAIASAHSSEYRSPAGIEGTRVLVIGGGNSGAQIAEELATDRDVTLSVAAPLRFMPQRVLGMSVFRLLDFVGALSAPTDSLGARILRRRGDPIFGTTLRRLIKDGRVHLRAPAVAGQADEIAFADGSRSRFDAVVFCTGYRPDYAWLQVPEAVDESGTPRQVAGISPTVRGLGFVGLGWMRSRNSALIGGAGDDADYVISQLRTLQDS